MGGTGRFKTALASLLQQHFGTGFAAHRLPGSWASTANFNERLAFIAKDTLLVIDDFRPGAAERRRLEGEADRLLRAAANGAGRPHTYEGAREIGIENGSMYGERPGRRRSAEKICAPVSDVVMITTALSFAPILYGP